MNRKKPTIKDVASAAGVSTQTISHVLNDRPGVAPETRKRILKIIADLNDPPNEALTQLSCYGFDLVGQPYTVRRMIGREVMMGE